MSLDEVGEAFGVSRSWIQQLEKSGLAKLRASREGRELAGMVVGGEGGDEYAAPMDVLERAEGYEARESA